MHEAVAHAAGLIGQPPAHIGRHVQQWFAIGPFILGMLLVLVLLAGFLVAKGLLGYDDLWRRFQANLQRVNHALYVWHQRRQQYAPLHKTGGSAAGSAIDDGEGAAYSPSAGEDVAMPLTTAGRLSDDTIFCTPSASASVSASASASARRWEAS